MLNVHSKTVLNGWFLFLASAAILLAGLFLEIYFNNNFFQRFGSLLVVFALCLVAMRAKAERESIFTDIAKNKFEPNTLSDAVQRQRDKKEHGESAAVGIAKARRDAYETLSQKSENQLQFVQKITYAEIIIAVVETIVWGFGDCITKLILDNCSVCCTC